LDKLGRYCRYVYRGLCRRQDQVAETIILGIDLAYGFLAHVATPEWAAHVISILEMSARDQGDDEFAGLHGLV
jgi:hypothetical protein